MNKNGVGDNVSDSKNNKTVTSVGADTEHCHGSLNLTSSTDTDTGIFVTASLLLNIFSVPALFIS